jgi:uncharacterized protein YeeX (DUF496 family)
MIDLTDSTYDDDNVEFTEMQYDSSIADTELSSSSENTNMIPDDDDTTLDNDMDIDNDLRAASSSPVQLIDNSATSNSSSSTATVPAPSHKTKPRNRNNNSSTSLDTILNIKFRDDSESSVHDLYDPSLPSPNNDSSSEEMIDSSQEQTPEPVNELESNLRAALKIMSEKFRTWLFQWNELPLMTCALDSQEGPWLARAFLNIFRDVLPLTPAQELLDFAIYTPLLGPRDSPAGATSVQNPQIRYPQLPNILAPTTFDDIYSSMLTSYNTILINLDYKPVDELTDAEEASNNDILDYASFHLLSYIAENSLLIDELYEFSNSGVAGTHIYPLLYRFCCEVLRRIDLSQIKMEGQFNLFDQHHQPNQGGALVEAILLSVQSVHEQRIDEREVTNSDLAHAEREIQSNEANPMPEYVGSTHKKQKRANKATSIAATSALGISESNVSINATTTAPTSASTFASISASTSASVSSLNKPLKKQPVNTTTSLSSQNANSDVSNSSAVVFAAAAAPMQSSSGRILKRTSKFQPQ